MRIYEGTVDTFLKQFSQIMHEAIAFPKIYHAAKKVPHKILLVITRGFMEVVKQPVGEEYCIWKVKPFNSKDFSFVDGIRGNCFAENVEANCCLIFIVLGLRECTFMTLSTVPCGVLAIVKTSFKFDDASSLLTIFIQAVMTKPPKLYLIKRRW